MEVLVSVTSSPSKSSCQQVGISWFWIDKIENMAWTAPAAPNKCPIDDFVELIDRLLVLEPKSFSIALSSFAMDLSIVLEFYQLVA